MSVNFVKQLIFCALIIMCILVYPLPAMPTGKEPFSIEEIKTEKGTLTFTINSTDSAKSYNSGKYIGLYLTPASDITGTYTNRRIITWTLMPEPASDMTKKILTLVAPVPSGLTQGDYSGFVAGVADKTSGSQGTDLLSPPYEISFPASIIPASSGFGALASTINNTGIVCAEELIPDYQIDSVEGKGNKMWFNPGDEINVLLTVTNMGNSGCYDSPVPVLLSFGPQILIPVQATITPPGPGETVSQELIYRVPGKVTPGSYHLSAVIDPYHIRPETNRENNTYEGTSLVTISIPSTPHTSPFCGC